MKYKNIREKALKNKIGVDWFKVFDTREILGNIVFTEKYTTYNKVLAQQFATLI